MCTKLALQNGITGVINTSTRGAVRYILLWSGIQLRGLIPTQKCPNLEPCQECKHVALKPNPESKDRISAPPKQHSTFTAAGPAGGAVR